MTGKKAKPRRPHTINRDVSAADPPTIAVVDALARLQLQARRQGGTLHLENAFAGLDDVLPSSDGAAPLEVTTDADSG